MLNFLEIIIFIFLAYLGVHAVFYVLEVLEQRTTHRARLREVLGLDFKI